MLLKCRSCLGLLWLLGPMGLSLAAEQLYMTGPGGLSPVPQPGKAKEKGEPPTPELHLGQGRDGPVLAGDTLGPLSHLCFPFVLCVSGLCLGLHK